MHYHLWFKWRFCRQASQFHESVNLQRRCARRCLHWWFCIHHSIMSRLKNPNCGVSPLSHYAWCWDTDRRKSDEINTKSDEVSKSRCEWMYFQDWPHVWRHEVMECGELWMFYPRLCRRGIRWKNPLICFRSRVKVQKKEMCLCCGVFWAFQWFSSQLCATQLGSFRKQMNSPQRSFMEGAAM